MAIRPLPCHTLLRLLLRYEPETGHLYWRERGPVFFPKGGQRAWNSSNAGTRAFSALDTSGYHMGAVFKRAFKAHRIIFKMAHGRDPKEFLDHINGDRRDNRVENLREATATQNARNQSLSKNKTASRYKGVGYTPTGIKRWLASASGGSRLKPGCNRVYLGYHVTEEEAARAYDAYARQEYGEFAKLNFPD